MRTLESILGPKMHTMLKVCRFSTRPLLDQSGVLDDCNRQEIKTIPKNFTWVSSRCTIKTIQGKEY